MASSTVGSPLNLSELFKGGAAQFRGLNPNEPGRWPLLPKVMAWLAAALLALVAGWFGLLSDASDKLQSARVREPALKEDFRKKLNLAINLDELRKQKLQVQEYVTQIEKQLPGKAEMDALLSDINQAGLGRGLQFELFKPGQVVVKDYYAELPISIKVSGRYHDMGAFAGDIANLSRIVTLHNLDIKSAPRDASGALGMEATARTYRYLDPNEVEEIRKNNAKAKAAGAKK